MKPGLLFKISGKYIIFKEFYCIIIIYFQFISLYTQREDRWYKDDKTIN